MVYRQRGVRCRAASRCDDGGDVLYVGEREPLQHQHAMRVFINMFSLRCSVVAACMTNRAWIRLPSGLPSCCNGKSGQQRASILQPQECHDTNHQKPLFFGENRVNFLQSTPEAFIDGSLCGANEFSQLETTQSCGSRCVKLCCNFDSDQS